jgi:hypothetical protein
VTLADVEELITHVQMQPGWQMTAELGNHEGPWLRVYDPDVPNSYGGSPTYLDIHIPIRDILAIRGLTRDQFYDWLHSRLERLAMHEHHEFFRIDGKAWVDPHAEGYGLVSWGRDHAQGS